MEYTHYIISIFYFILFWWSPFIPSRNLDEVFTYNHAAPMSLRSHYHVMASIVLKGAVINVYTMI